MIYAKFNESGCIIEFTNQEKEGYVAVPNLNCRLVNGNIVDETDKVLKQDKIRGLKNWFDTTYRYKYEKYTRLIALNKLDDDGIDPNEKLLALYEEAEDTRRQIQELEEE